MLSKLLERDFKFSSTGLSQRNLLDLMFFKIISGNNNNNNNNNTNNNNNNNNIVRVACGAVAN
jgi:hypothetical protein